MTSLRHKIVEDNVKLRTAMAPDCWNVATNICILHLHIPSPVSTPSDLSSEADVVHSFYSNLVVSLNRMPLVSTTQKCRHAQGQSQTCFRKASMLTFLLFISTIQGCSNILQGVALLAGVFSKQHSMKYFIPSPHLIPFSGSSLSFGIGCATMYVSRSIRPALGCISVPSAGNGKRCCATSRSVTPKDQTSDVMV